MRKHIIVLAILLPLQALSTVAFAYFIPHLSNMLYYPKSSLFATIEAEYAMGGWAMIAEFVVIVVAILGTIGFEVWLLVSEGRETRKNTRILEAIAEKLGVDKSKYSDEKQRHSGKRERGNRSDGWYRSDLL